MASHTLMAILPGLLAARRAYAFERDRRRKQLKVKQGTRSTGVRGRVRVVGSRVGIRGRAASLVLPRTTLIAAPMPIAHPTTRVRARKLLRVNLQVLQELAAAADAQASSQEPARKPAGRRPSTAAAREGGRDAGEPESPLAKDDATGGADAASSGCGGSCGGGGGGFGGAAAAAAAAAAGAHHQPHQLPNCFQVGPREQLAPLCVATSRAGPCHVQGIPLVTSRFFHPMHRPLPTCTCAGAIRFSDST